MAELPFSHGSKLRQTFQILADGDWHCGKHDVPGTQPEKAIQIIRQNGYEVENRTQRCMSCDERTVHRRLISTSPSANSVARSVLPEKLKRRVKALYKNIEAITQRAYEPNQLEVDHRFPQVRWSGPEAMNDPGTAWAKHPDDFQPAPRASLRSDRTSPPTVHSKPPAQVPVLTDALLLAPSGSPLIGLGSRSDPPSMCGCKRTLVIRCRPR